MRPDIDAIEERLKCIGWGNEWCTPWALDPEEPYDIVHAFQPDIGYPVAQMATPDCENPSFNSTERPELVCKAIGLDRGHKAALANAAFIASAPTDIAALLEYVEALEKHLDQNDPGILARLNGAEEDALEKETRK